MLYSYTAGFRYVPMSMQFIQYQHPTVAQLNAGECHILSENVMCTWLYQNFPVSTVQTSGVPPPQFHLASLTFGWCCSCQGQNALARKLYTSLCILPMPLVHMYTTYAGTHIYMHQHICLQNAMHAGWEKFVYLMWIDVVALEQSLSTA